jgi:hypothetical protein
VAELGGTSAKENFPKQYADKNLTPVNQLIGMFTRDQESDFIWFPQVYVNLDTTQCN